MIETRITSLIGNSREEQEVELKAKDKNVVERKAKNLKINNCREAGVGRKEARLVIHRRGRTRSLINNK